jgi:hypothetical protein
MRGWCWESAWHLAARTTDVLREYLSDCLSFLSRSQLTHSYFTEGAFDPIAVTAGIIQTAIYADFGYIVSRSALVCRGIRSSLTLQYVTKVLRGEKFELPA